MFNFLKRKRTIFPPPSPEERKKNISLIMWPIFDILGYEPHDPQIDCHLSEARFKMEIAGTRGGKSYCAAMEAVVVLCAGATRTWIVGPTYSLTEKEFRYVYEVMTSDELAGVLGQSPIENAVYNESQGNMMIRTKWGATILCISLERSGGAFGEEVDHIVMSEAAQIRQPRRLYQRIIRGRITTRLGTVTIPTTPAGNTSEYDPDGWLFEMYERGYDPAWKEYFTREWPSWANPFFPEDPYELKRELDPRIFAEQYEGKFVTFTGSIYLNYSDLVNYIQSFMPPKHWYRYEGIDPGFSGEFAWIGGVMSEQGNLYLTSEYEDVETSYEERVRNIKNKRCEEYGIPHGMWDVFAKKNDIRTVTYIDPEDPQCAFEFTKLGLPCIPANNAVMVGIDRVQRRLKYHDRYGSSLYITTACPKTRESLLHHSWGDKVGEKRKPANDRWKHKADVVRYICAGNLVASPIAESKIVEGDLWFALQELRAGAGNAHPHDLSQMMRRGG